jgi:hypothetical protein
MKAKRCSKCGSEIKIIVLNTGVIDECTKCIHNNTLQPKQDSNVNEAQEIVNEIMSISNIMDLKHPNLITLFGRLEQSLSDYQKRIKELEEERNQINEYKNDYYTKLNKIEEVYKLPDNAITDEEMLKLIFEIIKGSDSNE